MRSEFSMKNDRLHKNKIRFTPHHLRYNQSKQVNIILAKPDSHISRHQILHKNRCVLDFDCHGLFTNLMLKNYEIIYFSTQFSNANPNPKSHPLLTFISFRQSL